MRNLLIYHRPDGVIELRRRRLRDSAAFRDLVLLSGLCAGCVLFICALAALLVETPLVLAATAALVLPVVAAVLLARSAGELTPAPARSTGRRPPDSAA